MSAYGAILTPNRTAGPLPTTRWRLQPTSKYTPAPDAHLTIHHLTLATARAMPGLVEYLHKVFADELERGLTYPQEIRAGEEYALETFEAYYFAADVLVAVIGEGSSGEEIVDGREVELGIEDAVKGRSMEECIAGCYYVKPNYPGRSSHVHLQCWVPCPPAQRGRGIGAVLARSYLHHAPRLGFEASVFNLVYVNNAASSGGPRFTKAGLIPRAGRLKKADGSEGEEFVDAYVFYRRFDQ
ncbi:uncharacterized protein B0H18DRAFT_1028119 [Fomitopsis serialis]|uniref:uncharacterized protein n=1 Tax=Fomitopsis serialis TaxID=139415 RepID=UPI00200898A2|nr:uncharacterized protein B0H18DRAFT_1028119 [Neoantrodia serialis]KAH9919427.1 hypothetical protein B0H18DRAFT_1028119 [Neoantrodia serialis]